MDKLEKMLRSLLAGNSEESEKSEKSEEETQNHMAAIIELAKEPRSESDYRAMDAAQVAGELKMWKECGREPKETLADMISCICNALARIKKHLEHIEETNAAREAQFAEYVEDRKNYPMFPALATSEVAVLMFMDKFLDVRVSAGLCTRKGTPVGAPNISMTVEPCKVFDAASPIDNIKAAKIFLTHMTGGQVDNLVRVVSEKEALEYEERRQTSLLNLATAELQRLNGTLQ